MKQNELFNKCCENIDHKTREEVWRQMDKELGRTELEQAAANYVTKWYKTNYDSPSILLEDIDDAFKAGAEWQKEPEKLTWKEAQKLCKIYGQVSEELDNSKENFPKWSSSSEDMFNEILRRFYKEESK